MSENDSKYVVDFNSKYRGAIYYNDLNTDKKDSVEIVYEIFDILGEIDCGSLQLTNENEFRLEYSMDTQTDFFKYNFFKGVLQYFVRAFNLISDLEEKQVLYWGFYLKEENRDIYRRSKIKGLSLDDCQKIDRRRRTAADRLINNLKIYEDDRVYHLRPL